MAGLSVADVADGVALARAAVHPLAYEMVSSIKAVYVGPGIGGGFIGAGDGREGWAAHEAAGLRRR